MKRARTQVLRNPFATVGNIKTEDKDDDQMLMMSCTRQQEAIITANLIKSESSEFQDLNTETDSISTSTQTHQRAHTVSSSIRITRASNEVSSCARIREIVRKSTSCTITTTKTVTISTRTIETVTRTTKVISSKIIPKKCSEKKSAKVQGSNSTPKKAICSSKNASPKTAASIPTTAKKSFTRIPKKVKSSKETKKKADSSKRTTKKFLSSPKKKAISKRIESNTTNSPEPQVANNIPKKALSARKPTKMSSKKIPAKKSSKTTSQRPKKAKTRVKKSIVLKCVCSYSTTVRGDLYKHMQTHTPPEDRPYKCSVPLCTYACLRNKHLILHMGARHGAKENLLSCSHCKFKSVHKISLSSHILRKHIDPESFKIKPFKCNYKGCGYAGNTNKSLTAHFGNQHGVKKYHKQCPQCDFSTAGDLKRHIKAVHCPDPNAYKCTYKRCKFSSARKQALNVHMAAKHGQKKLIKRCPHCKFQTIRGDHLKVHVEGHLRQKSFECHYSRCSYVSAEKIHLNNHLARKHGLMTVPIKRCPHCDYFSVYGKDLKRHVEIHLPAHKKSFQCEQRGCKYGAPLRRNLEAHLASKHGQKKFLVKKCDYCKYATINCGHLKRHLSTHGVEENKRYKCRFSYCRFSAALKRELVGHLAKKHL